MSDSKGWPITFIAVRCPHCQSEQIVKRGTTPRAPMLFGPAHRMHHGKFSPRPANRGCLPEVKPTIVDMSLNASSMRATARVLRLSTATVLSALKKKEALLASVNTALLRTLHPAQIVVDIEQAGEAEIDEMWSFVGHKGHPRWLWHAIDHHTGAVLAYVFGRRQDEVFLPAPSVARTLWADALFYRSLGAYTRHLDPDVHSPETAHPEDRASASDVTGADQTVGPQNDLLLENHADA